MPSTLLREQFFVNTSGVGLAYNKVSDFFNEDTRTTYSTQAQAASNTPRFELAKDARVYAYAYQPGKPRGVYYDGNGSVYTQNFPAPIAGILDDVEVKLGIGPYYTTGGGANDACVDITGQYGLAPYQIILQGTTGNAAGYSNSGSTSPSELYPVRYYNLASGRYVATVIDALGHAVTKEFFVTEGSGPPMGARLSEAFGGLINYIALWTYNGHTVQNTTKSPLALDDYQAPYGLLVDGFFSLSTTNWRRVYSDGNGGVYFEDFVLNPNSLLELDNLIVFHPDTPAEANGGVLLEMRAIFLPLSFELNGTTAGGFVGPVFNQTGIFDGLAAGGYVVDVLDARGVRTQVTFQLKNRFRKRWQLVYDDLYGRPLRVELWLRGSYDGPAENICGQGSPVLFKSDGLSGAQGGQGDVPPVVGSSCDLQFRVPIDTFEGVVIGDDRLCRADVYYNNQLEFRGFVQPDIYTAPLLDGLQPVTLTATDGLAALKDTDFTGNLGQRLTGHRPVLNTLLHCLSRCDVSLPVRLFVNRRDAGMATTEAPEALATTNRAGYWDEEKNEPWTDRQVVDALAQLLGGTLVQRQGTWQIRSALEASLAAPGRSYRPAGTFIGNVTAPAPSATVEPPTLNKLYWLTANQQKQVRTGWKSLTGSTDIGWVENAYVAGKVFSDKYAWFDQGQGKLQPITGWHPAPGSFFPIVLVRSGEKGSDYTTQWARSTGYSTLAFGEYLEGPGLPLAAGMEAIPATLQFTGRFVPAEYYLDGDDNQVVAPTNAANAVLSYELVVDGQGAGVQFVEFTLGKAATDKDITVSVPLAPLPSGTQLAQLRVYRWYAADTLLFNSAVAITNSLQVFKTGDVVKYDFGTGNYRLFVARRDTRIGGAYTVFLAGAWPDYFAELTATNGGLGNFYLSSVGVKLTPQNATWEGEDNFRADGPSGTIRPKDVLEVVHDDVPLSAGLYSGNLDAFSKTVGLTDGTQTTSWARSVDKAPSGLLEANVLDGLALRANPSRLVPGTVRYENAQPPRLLDTLDLPFDIPGRRFWVVAVSPWDMKQCECEVTLVEIGRGAGATNPLAMLPSGARVLHQVYQYLPGQYAPYVRLVQGGGVRVRHS